MKVIKKGSGQKGWSGQFKCTGNGNGGGGCGAVLRVEEGDLFHTYRGYYDGSEDWFVTFRCCDCGVLTDIPDGKVPRRASSLPHYLKWCAAHNINPDRKS